MKNELQIFNYQAHEIRTIEDEGEAHFVLKDLCEALGLGSPHKVAERLDEDERKQIPVTDSLGRMQDTTVVNESGLYSVILRSDKKEAAMFKRWATHEVLPSIRKNGYYVIKAKEDELKAKRIEIMEQNARSREAALWLKIGENVPISEYKQICASYASKTLAGLAVLPLPVMERQYYTAQEVGARIGITANMVGRISNAHGLKAPQGQANRYGRWFWDKAKHSSKEVPTWKYTDDGANTVEKFFKEEKSCFM